MARWELCLQANSAKSIKSDLTLQEWIATSASSMLHDGGDARGELRARQRTPLKPLELSCNNVCHRAPPVSDWSTCVASSDAFYACAKVFTARDATKAAALSPANVDVDDHHTILVTHSLGVNAEAVANERSYTDGLHNILHDVFVVNVPATVILRAPRCPSGESRKRPIIQSLAQLHRITFTIQHNTIHFNSIHVTSRYVTVLHLYTSRHTLHIT